MRSNLLMNCLWYEDISPDELASVLGVEPEQLFHKIFGEEAFTAEEIHKIVGLLGLTEEETETIFGGPYCGLTEPEPKEEPEPRSESRPAQKDLITREAAIVARCARCQMEHEYKCPFSSNIDECPDVREILDIEPTDPSAAVVHCGECEHYHLCDGVTLDDGSPYPICLAPGGSGAIKPTPDFWCAYGEPKKGVKK